jgi:hypothetical protein
VEETYTLSLAFNGEAQIDGVATRIELTRKQWWEAHIEPIKGE